MSLIAMLLFGLINPIIRAKANADVTAGQETPVNQYDSSEGQDLPAPTEDSVDHDASSPAPEASPTPDLSTPASASAFASASSSPDAASPDPADPETDPDTSSQLVETGLRTC
jgi:hypothetical protein